MGYINNNILLVVTTSYLYRINSSNYFTSYLIRIEDYSIVKKILIGYNETFIIFKNKEVKLIENNVAIKDQIFNLVYLSDSILQIRNNRFDKIYLIEPGKIELIFNINFRKNNQWSYTGKYPEHAGILEKYIPGLNQGKKIDYNIFEKYINKNKQKRLHSN